MLLDNETYRIGIGILGGVTVTLKTRSISLRVPRPIADHFKATIDAFTALGGRVAPDDEDFIDLCEDFAGAVFGSDAAKQRVFGSTPAENASWHRSGE